MSFRRTFSLLLFLGSLFSTSVVAIAQSFDQYGGYLDLLAPGGATGYFRVEKIGNRWVFVTPEGHVMWMRSVQNIGDYFFPGTAKYPGGRDEWATQVRRRLKSWGFNTIGEYAAAAVQLGTTDQMPFIWIFRPANNALRNTAGFGTEAVKEILGNVPVSTYNGYRGLLLDAFDPKYPAYAAAFFDSAYNFRFIPGGATNPWLIGYATEDGDEWFGVTVGDGPDTNVIKAHPAWSVLVSADPMAATANPGGYGFRTYTDLTNYSKLALRDFLKARYTNDLGALNVAWGSTYTSWDHNGGYQTGSGLLDESGQNAWVARDWNTLSDMTAAARKDLDDFLEVFTDRLASVAVQAIRAQDPNHLIFSPDTVNQWGYVSRVPALRAMARWFDVLHVGYQEGPIFSAERKAAPGQTYDITGRPMVTWIGFTANADSSMYAFPNPFGVDSAPDQATRGQKYATYLSDLLNARGANGDYPLIGIDFWGWGDQTNENANWGLVSLKDNAYDGKEAIIAAAIDPWGYPTGGEDRNYGDFLSSVIAANTQVYQLLSGQTLVSTTTSVGMTSSTTTSSGTISPTTAASTTTSPTATTTTSHSTTSSGTTSPTTAASTTASPTATTTTFHSTTSSGTTSSISPPPSVSILFPFDGDSVIRRTTTTVIATASGNLGVNRVEFYINGSLKCTVTMAPYACDWRVPAALGNTYDLQAKAYDPLGNVGSSSVVTVTATRRR